LACSKGTLPFTKIKIHSDRQIQTLTNKQTARASITSTRDMCVCTGIHAYTNNVMFI